MDCSFILCYHAVDVVDFKDVTVVEGRNSVEIWEATRGYLTERLPRAHWIALDGIERFRNDQRLE